MQLPPALPASLSYLLSVLCYSKKPGVEWSQTTWGKCNGVRYHWKFTRIRITAILIATVVGFVGESNSQQQEDNSCIAWDIHLALETERKTVKWNLDMHGSKAKAINICLLYCLSIPLYENKMGKRQLQIMGE